jgi:hypothetical protein
MESPLLRLQLMPPVLDPPGAQIPLFEDGFGRRVLLRDGDTGEAVEQLTFSKALVEVAGFAPALGDLVARLASARHASYARIRRVDRPTPSSLALVSDRVSGWRLADILKTVHKERLGIDVSAVINVLRQLIPAVALFSRHQRDLAIGNVGIERLIVTPQGRVVIGEHLLGSALESLHYSRERYWRELRVALPPAPRLSARADASGIGVVALSLLHGRPLEEDEYPDRLGDLIETATESSGSLTRPAGDALKAWLARALQVDVRSAFQSPREAQMAFEAVLAGERGYVTAPAALEELLGRYAAIAGYPTDATPPPQPAPVVVSPPITIEPAPAASSPRVAPPPPPPPLLLNPEEDRLRPTADSSSTLLLPGARESGGGAGSGEGEAEGPRASGPRAVSAAVWALAALAVAEAVVIGWLWTRPGDAGLGGEGELVVQSRPPGANVTVDGEARGSTPVTVRLAPGTHVLELRVGRAEPRVIPLTILPGVQTSQYVELQSVPTTGGLDVRSDPPRARVLVNGQARGSTPLVLSDLPPGDHEVVLDAGGGQQVKQFVRIEPGVTAQLVVPLRR